MKITRGTAEKVRVARGREPLAACTLRRKTPPSLDPGIRGEGGSSTPAIRPDGFSLTLSIGIEGHARQRFQNEPIMRPRCVGQWISSDTAAVLATGPLRRRGARSSGQVGSLLPRTWLLGVYDDAANTCSSLVLLLLRHLSQLRHLRRYHHLLRHLHHLLRFVRLRFFFYAPPALPRVPG